MKNESARYAKGIIDLWQKTTITVRFNGTSYPVPTDDIAPSLIEEPDKERTTAFLVKPIGKLALAIIVEYRWKSTDILVTLLAWNSGTPPLASVPISELSCTVSAPWQWNSAAGPSCVHPYAQPWGQNIPSYYEREIVCKSSRTGIGDMQWTPFRFVLSTTSGEDLVERIYNGLGSREPNKPHPLLRPSRNSPGQPSGLAAFLNSDYARHDSYGRHGHNLGVFMNGHSTTTGRSGSQKRLGHFPDRLNDPTSALLMRQIGELLWVHGLRPQNILGFTHYPATSPSSSYFYYSLHRTSRNLYGREIFLQSGVPAWDPYYVLDRSPGGIDGHNLEHGQDLLPLVTYYSGDYAMQILAIWHAQRLMSTLHTHGISDGGYFGGGVGVNSGVNARAFWRILGDLTIIEKALPGYGCKQHVDAKLAQILADWAPDNYGSLDSRPDTLIQGQRIPYFDVWQHSLGAWLATYIGGDAQTICRQLQTHVLQAWRENNGRWEMPKRVSAADPTFGGSYGTWHDGLVQWASAMVGIKGYVSGDLERKRVRLWSYLQSIVTDPTWATEEIMV